MTIFIIEGPEKAGKTTFAKAIIAKAPEFKYRHWGRVGSVQEYIDPLLEDMASPTPVIWDRAWPSEAVYSAILQRPTDLTDQWWAEWIFRRGAAPGGSRVIILGPSLQHLYDHRTPDDLPIDPALERESYKDYGARFNWPTILEATTTTVDYIVRTLRRRAAEFTLLRPPVWAGPSTAPVVFMGEKLHDDPDRPGWCPFGSDLTSRYGRILSGMEWACGWTNVGVDPESLQGRTIIACGLKAQYYCRTNKLPFTAVPHPAWLYRWGAGLAVQREVEQQIITTAGRGLKQVVLPGPQYTVLGGAL